jgi:alcohol dehydrogenase class IV
MLPSVVMLHAPFVEKMPAALAAETGMDALAHALESLWSRRATAESMDIAADALRGVRTHLADSVAGSAAARAAMMDAAYLAGRAIALTRTTASHALSYHLSTRFGVRHGHAAGITLPWMIKHTAARAAAGEGDDQTPPLKEKLARLIDALDVPDAAAAAELVSALMRTIGIATSLEAFGIGPADAEAWFGSINAERLGNHPCSFSRDDFFSMFASLFASMFAAPR